MKCNEVREIMPDLAAGLENPPAEAVEHLRRCEECAAKLEAFRQTMALLDQWKAPEPSPYFDVRLQARLREERARAPMGWWHWLRTPALALTATVLVAVGVSLLPQILPDSPHTAAVTQPAAGPGPGTAVGDLQALDKNDELYADFDVLDDLEVQPGVTANP
jgi:hypothetical protein